MVFRINPTTEEAKENLPRCRLKRATGELEKPHFATYITSDNPVKQGFYMR